ncbi:MAG: arginine--tRNA ligase [bacterium]|nr:arginine--tRNA ligase [bacterium]
MKEKLRKLITEALKSLGIEAGDFVVEHPTDLRNGDYSFHLGGKDHLLHQKIVVYLNSNKPYYVEEVRGAGGGFVNFYLSTEFFKKSIGEVIERENEFGKNENLKGEKVMVEHTDPNPFKEFHIGHLMPNVIGSTVANVFAWNGAEVKQACYQGDVGIHVAKAVWGLLRGEKEPYPAGAKAYEEADESKKEIQEINKKIYEHSDEEINKVYDEGKKLSLEYFDSIYKRLGTKFDYFFFESDGGKIGKEIVEKNKGKIFEESDSAVVFHAEKYDPALHTRVFISSAGLPTYEAKELGLAKIKFEKYPYTKSIVVTGNEIKDYFKVLLAAMKLTFPELAEKTKHLPHGMLRLPTGKMSSRTGDVITAEALIEEVKKKVKGDEAVAIGAIKYMILRQAIGNDIVFDIDKSVSTEGDSGVYLQYAYARTNSLLERADSQGQTLSTDSQGLTLRETHGIEKLLYRFPEVVERAGKEYAPHYIVTYLTELAGSFNNFYAHEQIIGDSPESPYRLAITKAFNIVMKNGLDILGIPTPERM